MAVGPTLLLQSSASQRDPDRAVKAERAGKALLQPWCSHPCHKPLSLRGLEREAPPTPAPGGAAEAQGRGLDRRRRAGGTRSRGSHLLSPCLGEGEAGRVCLPHRGVPEGQSERRLPWSLSQPHLPQIVLPHPSACVHSQTLLGAREQGPVFICKETAIEEWNFSLSSCVSGKPSSSPPQPHRTIWVQVSGPGGRRRPPQEEPVLSQTPLSTWLPSPTPGSPSPAGQKNHPNLPWELGQAMQGRPT